LLRENREPEARVLARKAVKGGIPLRPDVLSTISTTVGVGETGQFADTSNNWMPIPNTHTATVELNGGERLQVSLPVFAIPRGVFRFSHGVPAFWASLIGDGPLNTKFLIDPVDPTSDLDFLRYSSGMKADALIAGIGVICRCNNPCHRESFLSVDQGASKVAVINCAISQAEQKLDRVFWTTVTFDSCKIKCDGDWFRLEGVRFMNCSFEFPQDFPAAIKSRLENANGPVSIQYWARG
jgi:hypothetical protein